MIYDEPLYRPPSEARSLIIQVTIGCAHNTCTFCSMYKTKKFHVRRMEEIFADLDEMADLYGDIPLRIFLADGDALVLSTDKLLAILGYIRERFPFVQRITSYATVEDILNKSAEELAALHRAGLEMVYVGAESGDPQILKDIQKDVTPDQMIRAAALLKESGIALSLTLISGLGGRERLKEHALASARLVSAMKPEYLGFLTLMLEEPAPIIRTIRDGKMTLLGPEDVVTEMRLFLQNVNSDGTTFRANHASNYIMLKGELNKDIPAMLARLEQVEASGKFRREQSRRL